MQKTFNCDDINSYKVTHYKKNECTVFMPPIGTKLDCLLNLNKKGTVTTKETPLVVVGDVGDYLLYGLHEFMEDYTLTTGEPITEKYMKKKLIKTSRGFVIRPFKISSFKDPVVDCYATRIPYEIKDVQGMSVNVGPNHGCGDFLVLIHNQYRKQTPNMMVINGLVFSQMFDMRPFPIPADVESAKLENQKKVLENAKNKNIEIIDSQMQALAKTTTMNRKQLKVVELLTKKNKVVGCRMLSEQTGKTGSCTLEQLAFNIGRNRVSNCECELGEKELKFKGKGFDFEELPRVSLSKEA